MKSEDYPYESWCEEWTVASTHEVRIGVLADAQAFTVEISGPWTPETDPGEKVDVLELLCNDIRGHRNGDGKVDDKVVSAVQQAIEKLGAALEGK